MGTEQITVERSDAGTRIVSIGRLGSPLNVIIRQLEAHYDLEGRPQLLLVDASIQGQLMKLRTTVSGATATTEITPTNGQLTPVLRTDTIEPTAILLPNPFIAPYAALAARLPGADPGSTLPAFAPPGVSMVAQIGTSEDEQIQTLARMIHARRTQIVLRTGGGAPLIVNLWSDETGQLLRVNAPAQQLDAVREDIASVSSRRVTATRKNDESVRITANGFSLAGTVSKPMDAGAKVLPAVVLVGGSGLADRDETVSGIPIFGLLSEALADAGFLVLRYDKRGNGQSGGRPESATLVDYTEDVRAVLRYLTSRKDVDRRRLALVGHGEGGSVAMMAAAKDDRSRALVLLSAIGTTGAELNLEQVRRGLEKSFRSEAEQQKTIELQRKIQAAVMTGKGWDEIPSQLRLQADVPWFQSFLSFDPAKVMPSVDQPMLIGHGLLDSQVLPSHADKLEALAKQRKRGTVEVVRFQGVNHLLVPATTGEVDEYPRLTERQVSPEVSTAIAAWLQRTFASAPR